MATNNEIAAFEDFKFGVGALVAHKAERAAIDLTVRTLIERAKVEEGRGSANIQPAVSMVIAQLLVQDESGISRFYLVRNAQSIDRFKEIELEAV